MNESKQAQAIERWSETRTRTTNPDWQMMPNKNGAWVEYEAHRAIVDYQAQKITQLTKERDEARNFAEDFRDDEYDNDLGLSIEENMIMRREYAKDHPLPWEKK